MPSSSWPMVLGLIAIACGAVWYDAQHTSSSSQRATESASVTVTASK